MSNAIADRLGAWLSAALEDPKACDAFKADIRAWFDAGRPSMVPFKDMEQATLTDLERAVVESTLILHTDIKTFRHNKSECTDAYQPVWDACEAVLAARAPDPIVEAKRRMDEAWEAMFKAKSTHTEWGDIEESDFIPWADARAAWLAAGGRDGQ